MGIGIPGGEQRWQEKREKIDEIIQELTKDYETLTDEGDLLSAMSMCIQKLEEFRDKEL